MELMAPGESRAQQLFFNPEFFDAPAAQILAVTSRIAGMEGALPGSETQTSDLEMISEDLRTRLAGRAANAFAEWERQGLMLATKTRTFLLLILLAWELADIAQTDSEYWYGPAVTMVFIVLGLLQYACARQRFYIDMLKYLFVAADCLLLAALFTTGNPFAGYATPPAFAMHGSPFVYFFLFLMQSAFSLRPRLVIWCGLCIAVARTGMLFWVLEQPGVFTSLDFPIQSTQAEIAAATDPGYVHLPYWAMEVMASLLLAGGFAVLVWRYRNLVESQSLAERARANLARYFSPNVVDRLSNAHAEFGAAREQNVAVLFADIVGFTKQCERESAGSVIAMLREYHGYLGKAVFDNDGTLDKYLGDGLMVTFGTPEPGPHDARNALQCALDMLQALDAWNAQRIAIGARPVRVGIGVDFGPVIAGDVGNERRLEYSVIGDTVNIASRLEEMTRTLDASLVVSDRLLQAIGSDAGADKMQTARFVDAGTQQIRGRQSGVQVWFLPRAESIGQH